MKKKPTGGVIDCYLGWRSVIISFLCSLSLCPSHNKGSVPLSQLSPPTMELILMSLGVLCLHLVSVMSTTNLFIYSANALVSIVCSISLSVASLRLSPTLFVTTFTVFGTILSWPVLHQSQLASLWGFFLLFIHSSALRSSSVWDWWLHFCLILTSAQKKKKATVFSCQFCFRTLGSDQGTNPTRELMVIPVNHVHILLLYWPWHLSTLSFIFI